MATNTKITDDLNLNQKLVHSLYNVVVKDNMLSEEYMKKLTTLLESAKSFEEVNILRTRIYAIECYRTLKNNETLEKTPKLK